MCVLRLLIKKLLLDAMILGICSFKMLLILDQRFLVLSSTHLSLPIMLVCLTGLSMSQATLEDVANYIKPSLSLLDIVPPLF